MILDRSLLQEMFAHAMSAPLAPQGVREEACGILAGVDGRAVKFFPATNKAHSPTRYEVDDKEVLQLVNRELPANGWDVFGIFHSHTHSQAYPSTTDVNLAANWPNVYYFIASLRDEEPRLRAIGRDSGARVEWEVTVASVLEIRAFRIDKDKVSEEVIELASPNTPMVS
ncbi:MAG TPA: M67 family metallopeptidase [Chloroflexota bacterium]